MWVWKKNHTIAKNLYIRNRLSSSLYNIIISTPNYRHFFQCFSSNQASPVLSHSDSFTFHKWLGWQAELLHRCPSTFNYTLDYTVEKIWKRMSDSLSLWLELCFKRKRTTFLTLFNMYKDIFTPVLHFFFSLLCLQIYIIRNHCIESI